MRIDKQLVKNESDLHRKEQPQSSANFTENATNSMELEEHINLDDSYKKRAQKIAQEHLEFLFDVRKKIFTALRENSEIRIMKELRGGFSFDLSQRIHRDSMVNLFTNKDNRESFITGTGNIHHLNVFFILILSQKFIPFLNDRLFNNDDLLLKMISTILRTYNTIFNHKIQSHEVKDQMFPLQTRVASILSGIIKMILNEPKFLPFLIRALSPKCDFLDVVSFQVEKRKFLCQKHLLDNRWLVYIQFREITNLNNQKGEIDPHNTYEVKLFPLFLLLYKNANEEWTLPYDSIFICGIQYRILSIQTTNSQEANSFYLSREPRLLQHSWFSFKDTTMLHNTIEQIWQKVKNQKVLIIYEKSCDQ